MGEDPADRTAEVRALQMGLDLGLSLIDTAEMYGEGGAEKVAGAAIAGRRDDVFLVSKVYPHNASREGAVAACERSLGRLDTDSLDLYLLHWPGNIPLAETVEAFERLKADGKIRRWGISNFDSAGLADVRSLAPDGACTSNQVLYHLDERGIEWDLLPACRAAAIPVMAYSPLGEGAFLGHPTLETLAAKHGATPAAVALAWVLREEQVIAIPKAADPDHLRANAAALDLRLEAEDLTTLDAAFPPPTGPSRLVIT
jgi:diketogulonate reductase-like aldo/keto reductase